VIKCYTNLMLTFCFTYLITYLLVHCINQLVSHHCCVCSIRCLTLVLLAAKTLLRQHVTFYATNTVVRRMNFAGRGSKTGIAGMKILDVIIGMTVIVASEI